MKPCKIVYESKKTGKRFIKFANYGKWAGQDNGRCRIVAIYSTATGKQIS